MRTHPMLSVLLPLATAAAVLWFPRFSEAAGWANLSAGLATGAWLLLSDIALSDGMHRFGRGAE